MPSTSPTNNEEQFGLTEDLILVSEKATSKETELNKLAGLLCECDCIPAYTCRAKDAFSSEA